MIKKLLPVLISILIVLTACAGGGEAEPEASTEQGANDDTVAVVGLLFPTLYDPNYVSVQIGAIETASRLDVELIVRHADSNSQVQLDQVEELLALGIDALILVPVDSATVNSAAGVAARNGVPVITVERRLNSTAVVSHITPDNIAGGEMAAVFIAEQIQERGQVVELTGVPSISTAQERASGFAEALSEYPDIFMVSSTTADFDQNTARRVFRELLRTNPGIDAVFAHNDEMALGAIEAAEDAGLGDIVFVGFDATNDAITAIEEGRMTATIAQQPTEMGRLAVETAMKVLNGESVPELISVDLALIAR
jgi:ribose transport system substrate-binding protein